MQLYGARPPALFRPPHRRTKSTMTTTTMVEAVATAPLRSGPRKVVAKVVEKTRWYWGSSSIGRHKMKDHPKHIDLRRTRQLPAIGSEHPSLPSTTITFTHAAAAAINIGRRVGDSSYRSTGNAQSAASKQLRDRSEDRCGHQADEVYEGNE